jgi:DNA-binding NarL/FixJ family response regulator
MPDNKIPIAMADDHVLIRQALASLVESFGGYEVIIQASNGQELLDKIDMGNLPALILLDISMPVLNGIETAKIISTKFPDIKILALTMMDDEQSVIGMVRNGARGYIVKDAEPSLLKEAMQNVIQKGFHYSDLVTGRMIHSLQKDGLSNDGYEAKLTEREQAFLKYACTELTYKEIADRMYVSPRTVDGYRDALFEKLGVKSRVGLCLYSIRVNLI